MYLVILGINLFISDIIRNGINKPLSYLATDNPNLFELHVSENSISEIFDQSPQYFAILIKYQHNILWRARLALP